MNPDVYLISGLGADERLFSKLRLTGCNIHFIKWIEPLAAEPLPHYCARLSEQINKLDSIILVGVSFGGIIAIELAQLLPLKKTVIISSLKATSEKPWYFSLLRRLRLQRAVTPGLLDALLRVTRPLFGHMTSDEYDLFKSMLATTSVELLAWGVESVLSWKCPSTVTRVCHIHGDQDLIFPAKRIKEAHIVKGGNHFMIVQRADEISRIVNEQLK